jgi:translation initiation factor 1 (eIF-1/SUI1)
MLSRERKPVSLKLCKEGAQACIIKTIQSRERKLTLIDDGLFRWFSIWLYIFNISKKKLKIVLVLGGSKQDYAKQGAQACIIKTMQSRERKPVSLKLYKAERASLP